MRSRFSLFWLFVLGIEWFFTSGSRADLPVTPTLSSLKRDISPEFFGFNFPENRTQSTSLEALSKPVLEMAPSLIRLPGGTIANYWDWKTGWVPPEFHPLNGAWRTMKAGSLSLDHFREVLHAFHSKPLWTLNLLTSSLDSQIEMLKELKSKGVEVYFVELGNEYDSGGKKFVGSYTKKFPTVKEYADTVNLYTSRLKREFPKMKISIVGSSKRAEVTERKKNWNSYLYTHVKNVDAITFHPYGGSGMGESQLLDPKRMFEASRRQWEKMIEGDLSEVPKAYRVWITEYNLFDRKHKVHGTWAHGLMNAYRTLLFLEDARIENIQFHALMGSAVFGAVFESTEGFDFKGDWPKPDLKLKTALLGLTSSGAAFRLIGPSLKGAKFAEQLLFPSSKDPGLYGWAFEDGKGRVKDALVLNLSGEKKQIGLPAALESLKRVLSVSAAPLAQVASEKNLLTTSKEKVGKTVELEPYSITRLTAK